MKRRITLALILFSSLWLAVNSSWAANVQMTVSMGYKDCVPPGRWVPLWVKIKGAPKEASIEVTRSSSPGFVERYPCSIPSKDFALFELPFYAIETGDDVTVKLVASDQVLAEQHLKTYQSIFPGHLILTVQTPVQVRQCIGNALLNEPIKVIPISAQELPSMMLSYDSVSAIVLAEPSMSLNPAQKRALRSWLTGGGKLFTTMEAASALNDDFFSTHFSRTTFGRVYTLGLGKIVCSDREFSLLPWINNPQSWRELFGIEPYTKSFRMTPSLFGIDEKEDLPKRPISLLYLIFLTGWGGVTVSVVMYRSPKKRIISLLASAVIITLLAIPFGRFQQSIWRRGAVMHSHIINLPDGESLFFTRIQLPNSKIWDAQGIKASPWGVPIQMSDMEFGAIQPIFNQVQWEHRTVMPFCNVLTSRRDELNIVGFAANNLSQQTLTDYASHTATVKWEKRCWFEADSIINGTQHWRRLKRIPQWLIYERPWVERALRSAPERPWLLGKKHIRSIGLSLQGGADHEVTWMKPIVKEAKP